MAKSAHAKARAVTTAGNHYGDLSADQRKAAALEMAQEIRAHDDQMTVLAIAIQNYIDPTCDGEPEPAPKGEDAEIVLDSARKLLALLVETISNQAQQSRLIRCIEAM